MVGPTASPGVCERCRKHRPPTSCLGASPRGGWGRTVGMGRLACCDRRVRRHLERSVVLPEAIGPDKAAETDEGVARCAGE